MERSLSDLETVSRPAAGGGDDRNLTRSMGDAACFGAMVGCGETYFAPFALAIGLSETAAGLVASLPLLAGGLIQLVSPIAITWLGSLQRWVVAGAFVQAFSFVPLAIAAWYGSLSLPWLLLIAAVYWGAGLATGPAWNTWMEEVVPAERRIRFFARRSRLQQATTFVALMAAGVLLQWAEASQVALIGFATTFCIAAGFRIASALFLHRTDSTPIGHLPLGDAESGQPDSEDAIDPTESHDELALANWSTDDPVGPDAIRLLVYLVLMQAFIQFSAPYFVPYMLQQLEFSYGIYVMLISIAFLSKVLSMSFWAGIAETAGASRLLWIGGIGLVPLAGLWIVSNNLLWLAGMQVLSGIAWAAYELGFFLMFFETLPPGHRTRLLTYYNLGNTLSMCAGALAGAAVLQWLGVSFQTYYLLFAVSSFGRLLCLGVLGGITLPTHSLKTIRMRILSVRPGAGSVVTPIVASAEEDGI
ncbi:MFS transporter [Roseiconus nitratireducens]|uniref:MFS transporter n=2 Tax=Roseiconus nitratireducens TaxID=2605748 RepID=A0A5M6D390_9BACT|nr:MFS transporter [Roseiconus nitratireducens]